MVYERSTEVCSGTINSEEQKGINLESDVSIQYNNIMSHFDVILQFTEHDVDVNKATLVYF